VRSIECSVDANWAKGGLPAHGISHHAREAVSEVWTQGPQANGFEARGSKVSPGVSTERIKPASNVRPRNGWSGLAYEGVVGGLGMERCCTEC
jgi:hypothetical protein